MNIQHSSRSDSWRTPIDILDKARAVLGTINLDPASDEEANKTVSARRFFTKKQDGLSQTWRAASIFLNPPGGKDGNRSMCALFWRKLIVEIQAGNIGHAVFVAFSLEALQTTQDGLGPSIGEYTFVVPSRRIRFTRPDGTPGDAPSHSNMIVYVPGWKDVTDEFCLGFESLGTIVNRVQL